MLTKKKSSAHFLAPKDPSGLLQNCSTFEVSDTHLKSRRQAEIVFSRVRRVVHELIVREKAVEVIVGQGERISHYLPQIMHASVELLENTVGRPTRRSVCDQKCDL